MRGHGAFAGALAVLILVVPAFAWATSLGQTGTTLRPGDSGGGCVGCHGAAGVVSTQISGATALLPGATTRINFTVSGVTNPAAKVGINGAITKDAVNQPTFAVVAGEPEGLSDGNTQTRHSNFMFSLKTPVNGSASYPFDLTMPAGAVLGSTYTVYAVGNAGHSSQATQVGWNHAPNFTITVAPPTPTSLTANQAGATASSIPLSWAGTQGEHFRVLRKAGSYPSSATDGTATLIYEGNQTSQTATGLTAGTLYYFAAYGKAPSANFYSSQAAQTTAASLPNNPTALNASAASSSEINLSWNGTSAEYIVRGKLGAFPASPTDASAKLVYQGTATAILDTSLNAGSEYFYRVWGKVAGANVFSANHAQASASTDAQPMQRFVDASSGNDQSGANSCLVAGTPCRTITRAMTAAGSGDIIRVAPGLYNVALGEVFPIQFKSGVQLLANSSPFDTIIDGAGDTVRLGLFDLLGNASTSTRIEGFTLRNALRVNDEDLGGIALGGALSIRNGANGSRVTIFGNIFSGNEARGSSFDADLGHVTQFAWGGAIYVFNTDVDVINNIFVGNIARGGNGPFHPDAPISGNEEGASAVGGAIYFGGGGRVAHNTFHGNLAIGGNGGVGSNGFGIGGPGRSGAVHGGGNPAATFDSNLFVANAVLQGVGNVADPAETGALDAGSALAVRNNLFFANTEAGVPSTHDTLGDDFLLVDPTFHAEPVNLRLRNSSPARGTGRVAEAPDIDIAGDARPSPPSIGAFEASFVAQSIVFGNPPTVSAGGSASVAVSGGASGNPVVLSSSTPSICSTTGLVVNGLAAGTCTLVANQAGNSDFTAAPSANLSFPVLSGPSFALSVNLSGGGSVLSSPTGIDCGEICSANFISGANVSLTALPDAGFAFSGWSGDCDGIDACSVAMSQNRTVTASFEPLTTFAVFISGAQEVPPTGVEGSGFGVVVVNPSTNTLNYLFAVQGLSGALTGAHFHGPAPRGANAGVKIDIGASPFQGSVIYNEVDEADVLAGQWYVNYHTAAHSSGEVRGQLDNLGGLFSLLVGQVGSGDGSVLSSPAGIDCPGTCSAVFAAGSPVQLSATPAPGSTFTGWSGDCSGNAPTCQVNLDQVRNVTARFDLGAELAESIFASGFE